MRKRQLSSPLVKTRQRRQRERNEVEIGVKRLTGKPSRLMIEVGIDVDSGKHAILGGLGRISLSGSRSPD